MHVHLIIYHTHKLLENVFLSTSFGSKVDLSSAQHKRTKKEIEVRRTIGMEISPCRLTDTVPVANTTDRAGSVLHPYQYYSFTHFKTFQFTLCLYLHFIVC